MDATFPRGGGVPYAEHIFVDDLRDARVFQREQKFSGDDYLAHDFGNQSLSSGSSVAGSFTVAVTPRFGSILFMSSSDTLTPGP